ncbi:MAG: hypothetical protein AVDCRST_MAG90-2996 [uncultured Microvirga sp.]|uniref:Uncharacterized protein n=1 Tax=uncultured Microvirga sp. TaxID=412392 RepID=A0A6J4MIT9_9HYPH|nr:MAG: hypothetical protein AVDCRST_MAG90-2996 [uncultured Microvirga sp.]
MLWFSRFLQQRRERRRAVDREAGQLLTFLGDMAYDEARSRARACRGKDDRDGAGFWSKVAVEIANRTDREIGVKVVDRLDRDRDEPRVPRPTAERQIADYAVEIGRSLARMAKGEHGATELHNLGAAVRNATGLVPSDWEVDTAADALLVAAARLFEERAAAHECLRQGVYPPALQTAAQALAALVKGQALRS